MSAFLLPNAGWGRLPNSVRHGRLVGLYIPSALTSAFTMFRFMNTANKEKKKSN